MPNVDTKITYWTWDNYPYTWDATDVSWDEAYDTAYTLTNSDTLKVADGVKKKQAKRSKETAKFASSYSKRTKYKRKVSEAVKLADKKKAKTAIKRTDGFKASERFAKNIGWKHKQTIKVVENKRAFSLGRAFAEILGVSETYWDNIGYFLSASETFTIKEGSSKKVRFARTIADYIHLAEALNRKFIFKLNDGFIVKDSLKRSVGYKKGIAEKFSFVEKPAKKIKQTFSDVVGAGEGFDQPKLAKGFYEKVNLGELFKTSIKQISFEMVGVESSFGKNSSYNRAGIETLSFNDDLLKAIALKQNTNVSISESPSKHIQSTCADSVGIVDESTKMFTANILRDIIVAELLQKNFKHGLEEEYLKFTDAFYKNGVHFRLKFSDAFMLEDNYKQNFKLVPIVHLRVQDDFNRAVKYHLLLKDLFYVSETYWDNIAFYLGVLEQCNIHEVEWQKADKKVKQALSVKELLSKEFVHGTELEQFGLLDAVRVSKLYNRGFEESFGLKDAKLGSQIAQNYIEGVEFRDVLTKIRNLTIKELLVCDDEIGRQVVFVTVIKEALEIIEHRYKTQNVVIIDRVGVQDSVKKRIEKLSPEAFVLIDGFIREYIARRFIGEAVTVEDYLSKGVGLLMSEEMNTYDTLIKACEGILSNISITEGELTLDEFLDIVDRPPNYTKFIEFKVGEYEYKDALIRLTMATKVQQTQPIATNVVMHVDIPDTDDKGEVEITDTTVATKVYFNKFYYNPPEVNVNLKGGNTADGILIPNIVTTEGVDDRGRYFEVELLDETWLNRKTGKISWTSKGY